MKYVNVKDSRIQLLVTDVTVTNPVAVAIEDAVAMLPVAVDL